MIVGAVVLCGGESRRMGRPKAWLPFGPERMLQRVVRLVSSVADPIAVVAAPDQQLPALPESVVIARDPLRGQGPLQGLAAGLSALPDEIELVYATATDVPFLQPDWINRLVALIGDHDLAIPDCDGFRHPLAALYRRASVLPACITLLQQGRLRPAYLAELLRARVVAASELADVDPEFLTLRNLNTLADYTSALTLAGHDLPGADTGKQDFGRPQVHVELYGVPRLRAGTGQVTVQAASIGEALHALARACPALVNTVLSADGPLSPAYTLNINGQRFATDPATPLSDGDSLILLAIDVGG